MSVLLGIFKLVMTGASDAKTLPMAGKAAKEPCIPEMHNCDSANQCAI